MASFDDDEGARYFDVLAKGGRVVLSPGQVARVEAVRVKLAGLGVDDSDVEAAVDWARRGNRRCLLTR